MGKMFEVWDMGTLTNSSHVFMSLCKVLRYNKKKKQQSNQFV